jgi:hypothetical protein
VSGHALRRRLTASIVVLVLGVGGAAMLAGAELTTVYSIRVVTASCDDLAEPDLADTCDATGLDRHSGALFVLAALALAGASPSA